MKKTRGVSLWVIMAAFAMALSLPLTGWADGDRHSDWDDEDHHGCSGDGHHGDKHQDIVVHLKRHINDLQGATVAVRLATLMQSQDCTDVTIFLTLQGPRLADSRMPQDLLFGTLPPDTMPENNTLSVWVSRFLGAGGHMAVCPVCGDEIGLTEEDLIGQDEFPGQVTIASPPEIAEIFLEADKILDF